MMMPFRFNAFAAALGLTVIMGCGQKLAPSSTSTSHPLIYGSDDRKEYYEISDQQQRQLANSVGIILDASFVKGTADPVQVSYSTLNQQKEAWFRKPLCNDVKFRDQIQPGSCSGFLVSKTIFATAGHCVKDGIEDLRVIFNFSVRQPEQANAPALSVSRNQIYSFKRILSQKYELARNSAGLIRDSKGDAENIDFAFLELDRPVENAIPFTVEQQPNTLVGDPILVIGHPEGLPLKFASNAHIFADEGILFFANFDGFHGNSGSLVLNMRTGNVLGIYTITSLIPDWVYDASRNCMMVSQIGEQFGGDRPDEGIVKFSEILKHLEPALKNAIIHNEAASDETQPPSSAGLCRYVARSLGYDYLHDGPIFESSEMKKLWEGALLEVIQYEPVFYKGQSEGVQVRVIQNEGPGSGSHIARPGDRLWEYKTLFECK